MNIWYEDTLKKWLTKICFFVNETDFQRNTLSFKETKILIIKQLLNPLKFIETHWRVPDGVRKTVTSVAVFFLLQNKWEPPAHIQSLDQRKIKQSDNTLALPLCT